jgi:hypothetical protein
MRKNIFLNVSILCLLAGLVGCTGPEGPMGPTGATGATGLTGPPGPGNQTVYSFDLSPSFEAGDFALTCPEVDVDDSASLCSTVCVYFSYDAIEYISLPCTNTEPDLTTTSFFYTIEEDIVSLYYSNSSTTVPGGFTIFVTVINP